MKKSRYTEEQVIGAVKQTEAGRKAREIARELGVRAATLYAAIFQGHDPRPSLL